MYLSRQSARRRRSRGLGDTCTIDAVTGGRVCSAPDAGAQGPLWIRRNGAWNLLSTVPATPTIIIQNPPPVAAPDPAANATAPPPASAFDNLKTFLQSDSVLGGVSNWMLGAGALVAGLLIFSPRGRRY